MNKAELAAVVAQKTGMTKKDAEAAVTATFAGIADALKKGDGRVDGMVASLSPDCANCREGI